MNQNKKIDKIFMSKFAQYKKYIMNLVMPAIFFGFVTGTLTSFFVTLYKALAHLIIEYSHIGYGFLRENLYILPLVILAMFIISIGLSYIYRYIPNLKGGGIATSVGILRGIITFKWFRTFVGVFVLSLLSFLIGVPLGNEGPSVQMGTSLGRATTKIFGSTHGAWDRYSMTGGACAGFSVATGAPISGIIFAIEEAHQRVSPMIVIVASSSVVFANISSHIFAPIFGVSTSLFGELSLPKLSISQMWIPLVVGLAVGIFGALVLKYYKLIRLISNRILKKVPPAIKIFVILSLTVIVGVFSFSSISTGHDLILDLFTPENTFTIGILFAILIIRATLTIGASVNGVTGGLFIPSLALGAVASAIVGKLAVSFGLDPQYYVVILALGLVACLSGFMKSPLTAIVFALEALSCYQNILPVIIASLIAYFVTEVFSTKSINDSAMEARVEELNHGKTATVVTKHLTIMAGSFASGKQIRDIFWPANLFVLSVKKAKSSSEEVDEHGGKELKAGDILHVQYSTFDEYETQGELESIVGKQENPLTCV